MSNVSVNQYGYPQEWVDVTTYNPNVEDKLRLKYASFNNRQGVDNKRVYTGLADNRIVADVPFDNSISYCALGTGIPLSNLTYYRATRIYPGGWHIDPDLYLLDWEQQLLQDDITQSGSVTNFAFANMYTQSDIVWQQTRYIRCYSNAQNSSKVQRWEPDSDATTSIHIPYQTTVQQYNSIIMNSCLVAQVPVKNAVLVPYVCAMSDVSSIPQDNNPDNIERKIISLKDYKSTTSQYNYTTHPYVYSVGVKMHIRTTEAGQGASIQWADAPFNACMLMNPSKIVNGFNADNMIGDDPSNPQPEIMGDVTDYCICYDNANSSSYIPIMGKITNATSPDFNPTMSSTERIDFADFFYTGPYNSVSDGMEATINVFAWAGDEPTVTLHKNENVGQSADGRLYYYWAITNVNISEFVLKVMRATAAFGMFFAQDSTDAQKALDNDDMYLGILENGIGNGDYTNGQDNRNQPQWNWDDMHENDYDPDVPTGELPDDFPSQTEYSKFEYDNTTPRGMWRPFVGSYVLDASDVYNLVYACTDHYITMQDAIEQYNSYIVEQGLTKKELDLDSYLMRQWGGKANPMDCFITAVHYPFDISRYILDLAPVSFAQVGSWITPQITFTSQGLYFTGKVEPATTYGEINLGSITFPVRTNPGANHISAKEFSSFAPYVSATLYLPFCGSIEIEPEMYVDMSIGVRYVVDWRTGSCLALVYRVDGRSNYILDQVVPGQMGDTITLAMQDTTAYASTLANGTMQEQSLAYSKARNIVGGVQSGINLGMGIASTASGNSSGISGIIGGIAGIANAGINAADLAAQTNKAQYDIGVSQVPTRRVGTASPCANSMSSMVARLTFVYSKTEPEGNFADVMGHACLWFGQVKDSSGYTECTNVRLDGIQATEVEKEMIRSLLASGVYV